MVLHETSTGEKVVYGTELYKVLQVKSKYADWASIRELQVREIIGLFLVMQSKYTNTSKTRKIICKIERRKLCKTTKM